MKTFPTCRIFIATAALAAITLTGGAAAAQTVAAIKKRDALVCGVSEGIAGFSNESGKGWAGFDVDLYRALAAAVLNDAGKATMSREIELNLVFPAITYFDGQGFLVRKSRNTTSALQLDNVKVCVQG